MEVVINNLQWIRANIRWKLALPQFLLYSGFIYGLFLILSFQVKFLTLLWGMFVLSVGGIGTSVGSHRYFTHRSFKATRGLKLALILCQTISGEFSIHYWVRTHRLHHKFTDTDRDPTNINRGFFFSYVGYYFIRRHPDCEKEWNRIDVSDLDGDRDISFQYKYYETLWTIFTIGIPTLVPCILWHEALHAAFFINIFRYALNFSHLGFLNTLSHMKGDKPYDKSMSATDNAFVNYWTFGEGYHNFHHCFPQDFRCSENPFFNRSTDVILWLNHFKLAYDLKYTTKAMIQKRVNRTGDGSHLFGIYQRLDIHKSRRKYQ